MPNPHPAENESGAAVQRADQKTAATALAIGTATVERGGPSGPEPTRFGDWEKNGRCIDF